MEGDYRARTGEGHLNRMFLMFEIFGRSQPKYNPGKLKNIHRINGIIFIVLYGFIAYFCLTYIITSKEEVQPRVALHALIAFTVIIVLALKISFVRIYKKFYQKALTLGPLVALLTFAIMATSAGYYFWSHFFKPLGEQERGMN